MNGFPERSFPRICVACSLASASVGVERRSWTPASASGHVTGEGIYVACSLASASVRVERCRGDWISHLMGLKDLRAAPR